MGCEIGLFSNSFISKSLKNEDKSGVNIYSVITLLTVRVN
jgi:hypothetical protein